MPTNAFVIPKLYHKYAKFGNNLIILWLSLNLPAIFWPTLKHTLAMKLRNLILSLIRHYLWLLLLELFLEEIWLEINIQLVLFWGLLLCFDLTILFYIVTISNINGKLLGWVNRCMCNQLHASNSLEICQIAAVAHSYLPAPLGKTYLLLDYSGRKRKESAKRQKKLDSAHQATHSWVYTKGQ